MSSKCKAPIPKGFEAQLTDQDQALLRQLAYGLEQRSAATPSFASQAILRQIIGRSTGKHRKRKLVGFIIACAAIAGTPYMVKPTISAFRGKAKPVVVATSSSVVPKYIVGGLDEKDVENAYVSDTKRPRTSGTKLLRLRKGDASIDIATFGGYSDFKDPNGENVEVTPVQIGTAQGKKIVFPQVNSIGKKATYFEWSVPEGQLSATSEGVNEPELLSVLASISRTPFSSGQETVLSVANKNGFVQVGESTDPGWDYFIRYGPKRNFILYVSPADSLAEDSFAQAKKVTGSIGRQYAVSETFESLSFLTWIDSTGFVLHFGSNTNGITKALTDEQFNELVRLADSVREVDDATFATVITSRSFPNATNVSKVPRRAPKANVLSGTIDGVDWTLTAGETPLEKECQKITFSGSAEPFTDCVVENPKSEFVSLGAQSVGSANPKTLVFGVVKDTLEIIRVRNSEGTVVGEDFSIENSYLDGRAFAIELPAGTTGEVSIEGYSYDDDVADNLPEGQFLPDEAKPLATKTLTVK